MSGKILVVDNSQTSLKIIADAVGAGGYRVIAARSAEEGLRLLAAGENVDLIVTDTKLPAMDGLSLVREVRKYPGYLNVPVIVVSNDYRSSVRIEGMTAGVREWFQKPLEPAGFLDAVQRLI